MLARIAGVLERVEGHKAVVTLPALGVAVDVHLPAFLAERMRARAGETVTLHTLLQFEAHGQSGSLTPRLIGFASDADRRFFELFTTVKGVGGRRALRAMASAPSEIAAAVSRRDLGALQRLPEIGKRLAETIVAELHGKVDAFLGEVVEARGHGSPAPAVEQAVEALVRLGEGRAEAERKVSRAVESNPALATAGEILAAAVGGGR